MNRAHHISWMLALVLVGCGQSADMTPTKANRVLLAQLASDTEADIELQSQRIFDFDSEKFAACGRAFITQPGISDHQAQRYVTIARRDSDAGLTRFESTRDGNTDVEFAALWKTACPNYELADTGAAEATTKQANFDLKAIRIAAPNLPHDPWRVVERLRKLASDRDQYETTAAYNARLKALAHQTLFDDVKLDGLVAFDISGPPGAPLGWFMYDADRATLTYRNIAVKGRLVAANRPADINSGEKIDGVSPQAWADELKKQYYKDVDFKEELILALTGPATLGSELVATAKLSPQRAKAVHRHTSVIVIGKINAPYFENRYDLPLTGSLSTVRYLRIVPFSVKAVWMIDNRNGEVLGTTFKQKA